MGDTTSPDSWVTITCKGYGSQSVVTEAKLKSYGYENAFGAEKLKEIAKVAREGGSVRISFQQWTTRNIKAAVEKNSTIPLGWE